MSGGPEHGHQYQLFSLATPGEVHKGANLLPDPAKIADGKEIIIPKFLSYISVKQPWAGWNVDGVREVEVRTWEVNYRGILLIHAGKTIDLSSHPTQAIPQDYILERGVILGYAILENIERISNAQMWDVLRPKTLEFGPFPQGRTVYAWKLSRPTRFPTLIPLRGQVGFQKVGLDKIIKFIAERKGEEAAETTLAGLREAQSEFLRVKK